MIPELEGFWIACGFVLGLYLWWTSQGRGEEVRVRIKLKNVRLRKEFFSRVDDLS